MLTKLFVNAQLALDSIKKSASNFVGDERGVTAIEYSIIAAVMGIGIYVGLTKSSLVTNIGLHLKQLRATLTQQQVSKIIEQVVSAMVAAVSHHFYLYQLSRYHKKNNPK